MATVSLLDTHHVTGSIVPEALTPRMSESDLICK